MPIPLSVLKTGRPAGQPKPNYINAGVAANTAGNYTEVKKQFSAAINLAQTNEEKTQPRNAITIPQKKR